MRLTAILVLIVLAFAFVPTDACAVDHLTDASHHCVLVCHAGCHTAVIPAFETSAVSFQSTFANLPAVFSYNNPTILNPKRPPVLFA